MIDKTIFLATDDRQKETMQIAKVVHSMVIIGGKNSSNTQKLFEVAKQNCSDSICIETKEDLKELKYAKQLLFNEIAGSSPFLNFTNGVFKLTFCG